MATDATGPVTSPDNIPTYNTAADAPSGKGLNAIVAAIQAALSTRISKSVVTTAGDLIYGTGASTVARLGIGSAGQVLTVSGGAPAWAPAAGGLTLIADQLLGGTQASFDTNTILGGNIPSTYKHLRLILALRSDTAAASTDANLKINNDGTAGNYDARITLQRSDTNGLGGFTGATSANGVGCAGICPAASVTAGDFLHYVIDFSDYNSTAHNKNFSAHIWGRDAAAFWTGSIIGKYTSLSAITRLAIIPTAGNWIAGSRFTLYGLA